MDESQTTYSIDSFCTQDHEVSGLLSVSDSELRRMHFSLAEAGAYRKSLQAEFSLSVSQDLCLSTIQRR